MLSFFRPAPMGPRASVAANRGSSTTTLRPRGVLLGPPRRSTTAAARAHHNADALPPPPSPARRLLAAALVDPLHDLSVDFDRTYLAHRCGQSVPLFADGGDDEISGGVTVATAAPSDNGDARLDRCLLLQREYGNALGRLLHAAQDQESASSSAAALDAAVLLSAFVLSADGGDEGDAPVDLLLREARAAVDLLAERALSIARGDRSARGLSAAVSEAIFGVGGEAALAPSPSSPSSSSSSAAADRCFYHPSNSCALTVLRRIVARHGGADDLDRRSRKSRPGSPPHQHQQQQQQQQQSLGSPAALALVWSAVASRAGLPSAPLPLPSHTFVRLWAPGGASECNSSSSSLPWVVDPYNSGQVCTAGVVSARLGRNWGGVALEGVGGGGGAKEDYSGDQRTLHALCLVRLLCNLRESSWAPLPLTGRVRWRAVRGGEGGGGGGNGGNGKRSTSSRRTLWSAVPSSHDALAARLAVRARRGWMGGAGAGAASPPPPPLAPLAARCVRSVRLLRATLREMVAAEGQQHQHQQQLEAALPRLDRDEGYALCLGGMPSQGKEALAAYLAARPQAPDAAACAEFL